MLCLHLNPFFSVRFLAYADFSASNHLKDMPELTHSAFRPVGEARNMR